jgi:hypothetical protein
MHSAQTAWLADRQNQRDYTGGWPSAKFHVYSWALSAHCLALHYLGRTLVADAQAADLLMGQMQLPYTRVDLALDRFHNPFPLVWVLKKTLAYARQPGPFVHVDSDAYLFGPLPPVLAEAPLFAQNLEFDHPYYLEAGEWVSQQFADLPAWAQPLADGHVWAVNAGLIGGADHRFFGEFHAHLLAWLANNEARLHQVPNWDYFNTYVEQATIVGLARAQKMDFTGLLPKAIGYPYTYNLDQFWRVPGRCGYLHAMNYKQNPAFCEQLAQRLRLASPELYERANQVAQKLAATHHPVPEAVATVPQWPRLGEALAHWGLALPTGKAHEVLDQLERDPLPSLPPTGREVLGDLIAYERAWLQAQAQGQAFLAQPGARLAHERAVNDFWASLPIEVELHPGPLFAPIASQWNWAETNEFARQREAWHFAERLAQPPGYFGVVLLPYPEFGFWREYLLEPLKLLLFGLIESGVAEGVATPSEGGDEGETGSPITLAGLVQALQTDLAEAGQVLPGAELYQWAEDRLRFFGYFGIFAFA